MQIDFNNLSDELNKFKGNFSSFQGLSEKEKETVTKLYDKITSYFNGDDKTIVFDLNLDEDEPEKKDVKQEEKEDSTVSTFSEVVDAITNCVINALSDICANEDEDGVEDETSDEFVDTPINDYDDETEDDSECPFDKTDFVDCCFYEPVRSLCDELLEEVNAMPDTEDEIVEKVVSYVLDAISDKVNKPYVLHRGTLTTRPAVEVKLNDEVVDCNNLLNTYISDNVKKELVETGKFTDVVFSKSTDDSKYSVFIML